MICELSSPPLSALIRTLWDASAAQLAERIEIETLLRVADLVAEAPRDRARL